MEDNKFIVFKADEIYSFVEECMGDPASGTGSPLEDVDKAVAAWRVEDARVIRLQDMFASPALDVYANSIMGAVAAITGAHEGGLPPDLYGVVRRLSGIADYFHQSAVESVNHRRKLPD